MELIQIITQIYRDSLTLRYPTKYQYLIGIMILTLMGWSFNTLFDVDYSPLISHAQFPSNLHKRFDLNFNNHS